MARSLLPGYSGARLEDFMGFGAAAVQSTSTGTTTVFHTATGTSSRPRGALGPSSVYEVRQMTPEEEAHARELARVQAVPLNATQPLYLPVGGTVGGSTPMIQAGSADEASRMLEETYPQAGGFLSSKFFGLPLWGWGLGALAIGGMLLWRKRQR